MKKTLLSLTTALIFASAPSYAFLKLNKSDDSATQLNNLVQTATGEKTDVANSPLIGLLGSQFDIKADQAAGGAGALLALAQNSLSTGNNEELQNLIPGLGGLTEALPGMLSMASNMESVKSIFSSLGLDPSMVEQFTPIIIQYLTDEGATGDLINSLGKIW